MNETGSYFNETMPDNPDLGGSTWSWQGEPQFRGTFSIITSCISTLVICTWATIHVNIRAQYSRSGSIATKVGWMFIGILAPEYLLLIAFLDYFAARKLVREWNEVADQAVPRQKDVERAEGAAMFTFPGTLPDRLLRRNFTLSDAFYASMGGYVFGFRETPESLAGDADRQEPKLFLADRRSRVSLTANGFRFLMRFDPDLIPTVPPETIEDRGKMDSLARILMIAQLLWYYICTQPHHLSPSREVRPLEGDIVQPLAHTENPDAKFHIPPQWYLKRLHVDEPAQLHGTDIYRWRLATRAVVRYEQSFSRIDESLLLGFKYQPLISTYPTLSSVLNYPIPEISSTMYTTVVVALSSAYGGAHLAGCPVQLPGFCRIPPDDPYRILYGRLWNSPPEITTRVVLVPAIDNPAQVTAFTAQFLDLAPLHLTSDGEGRILARHGYHVIGKRVESDFFDTKSGFGGCVVIGHPGTDTSMFLYHQLFWYLHNGIPCVFQVSAARAYVFLSQDIYLLDLDDPCWAFDRTLRALECPEPIRVLVDSGELSGIGTPHSYFHALHTAGRFFVIQASPSRSAWYRGWAKRFVAHKMYVEPWSWNELYSLGTTLFQQTYQELAMAYNEFGPIPRLCLPSSPPHLMRNHARQSRRMAAEHLAGEAAEAKMESGWRFTDHRLDEDSKGGEYFVFLLSPRPACEAVTADLNVSTKAAAYEFCQALLAAKAQALRAMFQGYMWPANDYFKDIAQAGVVFEMIAHLCLSKGTPVTLSSMVSDHTEVIIVGPWNPLTFIHLADVESTSVPQARYCIFHSTQGSRFAFDSIYISDGDVFLFAMTVESSISVDITSLEYLRTVLKDYPPERDPWHFVFVVPRGMAAGFEVQGFLSPHGGGNEWTDLLCLYVAEFDVSSVGSHSQ
ncbi:hypothetical protein EIP91_010086 [Steccherinum ochraceum]|uniref:Uncharacterized protein n=1 Tax=Steccherinum ochraceum TaxID=92696 RepID=A0A4R0RR57_9APHY|nr:hypothetical protein EIP91_010086 [Steccherinum ochraceum]